MAVDIVIQETIDLVDITVSPNVIEVNVTRTSGGGGATPTLQQVTDEGATTDNPIYVSDGAGNETSIQIAQVQILDSLGNNSSIGTQGANFVNIDGTNFSSVALSASFNTQQTGLFLQTSDGINASSLEIKLAPEYYTDLPVENIASNYFIPFKPSGDYTLATLDDIGLASNGLPIGGTAGQILTKVDATDYNATWQENYADWTSVVKHTVKNNGTALITKGTAVYVTGSNGTNILVGKASNTSEATSSKTMGLMQSEITTTGGTQTGFVITEGLLSGLDTSSATAGDPIWLGVSGALIYGLASKPYAPAHLVFIGIVTKVSAGNGEIFVKVQNGFELKEIHDVDLITNTPTNNQLLSFDSATSLWKNKTVVEDTIVDAVTDKAPSQNAVFDALALKQSTSTLLVDSIDKAILRNNYFWFTPNTVTSGGIALFNHSERITASFILLLNGNLLRGMVTFATTVIAGTIASMRRNDALQLQGYECKFTRKIQFNSNVSGQRFFCGISKGNQFAPATNVEPNTLTDIVGVCQLSTSTNMHIVYNDASGVATTSDLGTSYPCNDSQYNYYITVEQTTISYIITVERVTVSTGASISTSLTTSTNIPIYNTGVIQLFTFITNNATASIASYLDGGAIGNFKN